MSNNIREWVIEYWLYDCCYDHWHLTSIDLCTQLSNLFDSARSRYYWARSRRRRRIPSQSCVCRRSFSTRVGHTATAIASFSLLQNQWSRRRYNIYIYINALVSKEVGRVCEFFILTPTAFARRIRTIMTAVGKKARYVVVHTVRRR